MPRCVCAVFDYSEEYVKRFSAYIKNCGSIPFTVFAFTNAQALENFLKREKADLLLLPERVPSGDICRFAENLCTLSGKDTLAAILGDKRRSPSGIRCINKYQSMEGIIAEITEILGENERFSDEKKGGDPPVITGIYSFGHLDKAVNFAFDLAGHGSGQKRALYVNLTRFSGLKTVPDEMPDGALSDVIYYFISDSEKIRSAYYKARGRKGNIDILTSPQNMEDLDLIGEDRWGEFLCRLAGISDARMIIWDMGEAVRSLINALDLCGRVWLICDPDTDRLRMAEFAGYLKSRGREDLLEKISQADTGKIR